MQEVTTRSCLLVLAVVGALTVTPVAAQVYKWTDAEGRVHFSDRPPPPDAKAPVTVKPRRSDGTADASPGGSAADGAPPAAGPKNYVEEEAEFRKRQVEAAEKSEAERKAAEAAAEKQSTCSRAKAQLASLQSGRITRPSATGEREFLTDAEIAQEISAARKMVDASCN